MTAFSHDKDLLRYEAAIFADLYFPSQVLCEGAGGVLSGTTFTKTGADFVAAGVRPGGVICIRDATGSVDTACEIVSVDAADQLTVSVLRGGDDDAPIPPPQSNALHYRISTFDPQAQQIARELTEHLGIRPGRPDSLYGVEDVVDATVLRQAAAYGVLAQIFATLADDETAADGLWDKSRHYRRLYEAARQRCRISIDAGADGIIEKRIVGGSARLVRD